MEAKREGSTLSLAALVLAWAAHEAAGQLVQVAVPAPMPPRAAPAPDAGQAKRGKAGLHLPANKRISLPWVVTDGAGYRWDIQQYGSVNQGTNGAYSGGLCLYVGGSRLSFSSQGWTNADGSEIEIGPRAHGNLRVHRRIKVYRDRGLARWVDIFENPSAQAVTVEIRLWSDMITTVRQTVTSSGKNSFTAEDHAFVTAVGINSAPALMHYVCSPRSKLRPRVTVQSDDINVYYKLTVPARDATVLCYFEAQNRSSAALIKQMKDFKPAGLLRDLSPSLRRRIVNLRVPGGFGGVELDRSNSSDVVRNRHGDPIYGTITNESFRLETLFGPITMPAGDVIGLAAGGGGDRHFRALLTGGQILAGQMAADANVVLKLPAGGTLRVPFAAMEQCAFRVSKQRPEETEFAGPLLVLRTGDRVAFDPAGVALTFRTRHGVVRLAPEQLLTVALDKEGNGVHRATFLNGSQLAGILEPDRLSLTLKLGPKCTVDRNLLLAIRFAEEEQTNSALDTVLLSNGDELFGRIAAKRLTLATRYGEATLEPVNVAAISLSRTHLGRAAVRLWDGSVLRGQFRADTLPFEISPGPTLAIYVGQYVRIDRSQALPPEKVRKQLLQWIGQLGAESYQDREAATKGLVKMGKGVLPMLREHLDASDPEVRQRIQEVIERLGG